MPSFSILSYKIKPELLMINIILVVYCNLYMYDLRDVFVATCVLAFTTKSVSNL